jgi:hypothetical protein
MLETKLPIISAKNSKSGNDGSLLEIKKEELWVGSGYLSNEGQTQGKSNFMSCNVTTLALGSRPRQRGCKGVGQEEAQESHHRLPGV